MDKRLPVTRLNKFFSEDDYNFNVDVGMEYLHTDINMVLTLYRVDHNKTDNSSIYAEVGSDEIIFKPAVEFNGLVKIEESTNNTYANGNIRYKEAGNLIVSVYMKHLTELDIDINFGDYIGYPDSENIMRYYSVSDDGKINSSNRTKMFGYKPFYRTIVCTIAQEGEFRGI